VDGGGNIDTLELDGSGLTLDLTNISTGFISFLQNNPDILLNPKRSIGIDTLELDGSGLTLDLTNISNIRGT
jgi:hypothetical protein